MANEYQEIVNKLNPKDKELFMESIIEEIYNSYDFNKSYCPVCEKSFNMFLPFNGRKYALCPECSSVERHRLVYYYLKNKTILLSRKISFLDLSPHYSFINKFNDLKNVNYVTLDSSNGEGNKDKIKMDNLPFEDNSFDVIFNYFNLPKINQIEVLKEFHRVLNTNSNSCLLLFNFFDFDSDKTIKTHNKQVYGTDFLDGLKDIGFDIKVYNPNDIVSDEKLIKKYGILSSEIFIVCTKNKTKMSKSTKRSAKLKSPRRGR
ncbi:methyltransferase domain-containing protein [Methanobrevibacter sp.]|uniref:methyltransferase domain-containing protein n=1 Tax=Methanobrevibacter sp. TaxID=66852 RepID=UPI0038681974